MIENDLVFSLGVSAVGLVITVAGIWLSHQISKQKGRLDSITLMTDVFSKDVNEMTQQEKYIAEETISTHYRVPIYFSELLLFLSLENPKKQLDYYVINYNYLVIEEGKIRPRFKIGTVGFTLISLAFYVVFCVSGLMMAFAGASTLLAFDGEIINAHIYAVCLIGIGLLFTGLGLGFLFFGMNTPHQSKSKEVLGELFEVS